MFPKRTNNFMQYRLFIAEKKFPRECDHYKASKHVILVNSSNAMTWSMVFEFKYIEVFTTVALIIIFQVRGYNDGGWFTLYPNFGETVNNGSPYFFKVLGYVSSGT